MLISSFVILIPITLIVILLIVIIFWKALNSGQYDDLDTPSKMLLQDDDRINQIKE